MNENTNAFPNDVKSLGSHARTSGDMVVLNIFDLWFVERTLDVWSIFGVAEVGTLLRWVVPLLCVGVQDQRVTIAVEDVFWSYNVSMRECRTEVMNFSIAVLKFDDWSVILWQLVRNITTSRERIRSRNLTSTGVPSPPYWWPPSSIGLVISKIGVAKQQTFYLHKISKVPSC